MKVPFKRNNQPPALRLSDTPGEELDRELARQMSDGNREALARFVERHASYLYKYLQRRLGPVNDALVEATVKATLEVAFRRRRPYANGSARTSMRLWLLRLAEREIARRGKALQSKEVKVPASAESEDLIALREAIASLKGRQQAAMCLALFDGLSTQEIAGALGVREARAMRILRAALRRTGSALALAHAEVP